MQPCVFIHTNHKQHVGALAHGQRRDAVAADRNFTNP